MHVALPWVRVDRQLPKALAAILRHQQGADLYAGEQPVAVDHDLLDVADPWRRGKAPLPDTFDLAKTRQFPPAVAAIVAEE